MTIQVVPVTKPESAAKLFPLLLEFFEQTKQAQMVDANEPVMMGVLTNLIESPVTGIFAAVQDGEIIGATAGMLSRLWFQPEHVTGQELFWYVAEGKRKTKAGKLLFQAIEAWAKEHGAQSFSMVTLSHLATDRVGQMYEAAGYEKMETHYVKELK